MVEEGGKAGGGARIRCMGRDDDDGGGGSVVGGVVDFYYYYYCRSEHS